MSEEKKPTIEELLKYGSRQSSTNKCYPDFLQSDLDKVGTWESYPKDDKGKSMYGVYQKVEVNKFDTYSEDTTMSISTGYTDLSTKTIPKDDELEIFTVAPSDAADMALLQLRSAVDAMVLRNAIDKKYKYLYQLTAMYLSGTINKVRLYCKGVASMDKNSPLYWRYVIVVTGYHISEENEKRCKIHFELVTETSYMMYPSRILYDIEKDVSGQNMDVFVDQDSFDKAIAEMKKDNPFDKDKLTQSDINDAMSSLDERLNNITKFR